MNKFQEDVKLLADIQALIEEQKTAATMSPSARMIIKKLAPGMDEVIPEAQKRAERFVSVLTAAKDRLSELMEGAYK